MLYINYEEQSPGYIWPSHRVKLRASWSHHIKIFFSVNLTRSTIIASFSTSQRDLNFLTKYFERFGIDDEQNWKKLDSSAQFPLRFSARDFVFSQSSKPNNEFSQIRRKWAVLYLNRDDKCDDFFSHLISLFQYAV